MSNLSFARIMYGFNVDSAGSSWIQSSDPRSRCSDSPVISAALPQSWMQKLFSAILRNYEGGAPGSAKKFL
jgi:hypothetical protein